jgi:hypothetical protein
MQGEPPVPPGAGDGPEIVEEVLEAPEELGEVGTEEGEPEVAAKMEGRVRKRKKRH